MTVPGCTCFTTSGSRWLWDLIFTSISVGLRCFPSTPSIPKPSASKCWIFSHDHTVNTSQLLNTSPLASFCISDTAWCCELTIFIHHFQCTLQMKNGLWQWLLARCIILKGCSLQSVKISNINLCALHFISLYWNAEQFYTPLVKKYNFKSSQALLQHMLLWTKI